MMQRIKILAIIFISFTIIIDWLVS